MLNYRTQDSVQDGATLYGFWPLSTNETCIKWLKSVEACIIHPNRYQPTSLLVLISSIPLAPVRLPCLNLTNSFKRNT